MQQCFTFYSSPGISNCHCQQRGRSARETVFYILQQSRNLQLSLSTKRQISMCNSVLHSTAVQESPTVTVNKEADQHVQQCFTFYSSPGISNCHCQQRGDQHVKQCFTFYSSPGISNCHCQQRGRSARATVFYILQQSRNLQLSLSTKRQISMCNSVLHSTAVQESPTVTVNKEADNKTVFYILQQSRNLQLSL